MLGKRIKELRDLNKLTIKELSEKSGVGQSTISEIETGKAKNPKTETLLKLSKALNIGIEQLLVEKWDEEYNPNGRLADEIKLIESLENPLKAIEFILSQPSVMEYGGYDLNTMTEEEIIDLANDMLLAMRISIEKRKMK